MFKIKNNNLVKSKKGKILLIIYCMDIYFISGMSANCKVFDAIKLPYGFDKKYIEWLIPENNESLDEYTHRMSVSIDTSKPFVLVGYSFGGIIVQEMNKFLTPCKTIIIASMKAEDEIPALFRVGHRIKFAEYLPVGFFKTSDLISDFFSRFVYHTKREDMEKYISYTDPFYTKWSLYQILNWHSTFECPNLYHIHGTKDQMFPFKGVKNAYQIEGADHLLVMKKSNVVSRILEEILLK